MFQISANFMDRSSFKRWIHRNLAVKNSPCIQAETITARNVEFHESGPELKELGCVRVAHAEEINIPERSRDEMIELRFTYDGFLLPNGEIVRKVEELHLGADGKVFAKGYPAKVIVA